MSVHPLARTGVSAWVLLNALIILPLAAADWPWWRGPLSSGSSPESGLPVSWQQEEILWIAPLEGTGVSSPIAAAGRVFVTSESGAGSRRPGRHPQLARNDPEVVQGERALKGTQSTGETLFVVEAFSLADGSRLWQHRLVARGVLPEVHEKHNLASPSPVTDGERVYAWFGTGQVVALTVEGEPVWRRHLGEELGPFEINWGHGSSPALHGDLLFLLCFHDERSHLLALDKESGETRWQIERPPEVKSYSTPVVIETPEREELIVNSTEGIHAYDPATGELLWHADGPHRFGIGVPTYADGLLYASRGYRSGPYLALRPGGSGDVSRTRTVWRAETGAPYVSSLVYHRGLLFMAGDTGIVTCADAATGKRLWQERTGGIFSASPVVVEDRVYFTSETGEVFVYATARQAQRLARNRLEGRLVASPAVADQRFLFRADDRLIAVGAAHGPPAGDESGRGANTP